MLTLNTEWMRRTTAEWGRGKSLERHCRVPYPSAASAADSELGIVLVLGCGTPSGMVSGQRQARSESCSPFPVTRHHRADAASCASVLLPTRVLPLRFRFILFPRSVQLHDFEPFLSWIALCFYLELWLSRAKMTAALSGRTGTGVSHSLSIRFPAL